MRKVRKFTVEFGAQLMTKGNPRTDTFPDRLRSIRHLLFFNRYHSRKHHSLKTGRHELMISFRVSLCSLKAHTCARLASSTAFVAAWRVSSRLGVMLPRPLPSHLLPANYKNSQRNASSASTAPTANPNSICWKCHTPLRVAESVSQATQSLPIAPHFFCASKSCGVIQPPSAETNLFDLFALYGTSRFTGLL